MELSRSFIVASIFARVSFLSCFSAPNAIKNLKVSFSSIVSYRHNSLKPLIQDRCSTGTNDIGYFKGDLLEIELSSQLPINRPVFRRSQAENEEMEKQNMKLLRAGIIEESTPPYNNNVMGMKKANGKIRIVNDFRGINEIIIPLNFPIMMASSIFDLVAGSEIFSVTDMSSGFW
jgi:hypothetical protein